MNHKDINNRVASLLGEPPLFDVKYGLSTVKEGLTLEEAQTFLEYHESNWEGNCTIVSSNYVDNYCVDLELALKTAKDIAQKNECTYVLSIEDGEWRAAFGNYGDCAEYSGANPAYCTCMALLKFYGKI